VYRKIGRNICGDFKKECDVKNPFKNQLVCNVKYPSAIMLRDIYTYEAFFKSI